MNVTSIINQKGGVAKTTTSLNVAAAWGEKGRKVLLIDLDPQSSATKAVFGDREFDHSIYDVLLSNASAEKAIVHSVHFGIDMIPSDILLSGVDIQMAAHFGRESILKRRLESVRNRYDAVLIDCSPSLGLLTVNALMSSRDIIIPICPEYFSLKGIELILDTIRNLRSGLGYRVDVRGVVITRFRDRKIVREVIDEIRNHYGLKIFVNYVPDNIVVEEAHHLHMPVIKYAPRSKASKAYGLLAEEIWR